MAAAPLSLDLRIETPENVVLTPTLAGPAWRGAAYLLDVVIRILIFSTASMLTCFVAGAILPGLALGTLLLLAFLLEWGYFIGCEYLFNGRTPGKLCCGLRVVHENGQPLSWWGATLRNLLRAADILPLMIIYGEEIGVLTLIPMYGPAVVCMLLSPRLQRMGDLAARTVVIHERQTSLPHDPAIYRHIERLPADQINAFTPRSATLAVIDSFLTRRKVLKHVRGHQMARQLALALVNQLDYQGDRTAAEQYPMAFLARVYVTFAAPPTDTAGTQKPRNRRRREQREVAHES